MSLFHPEDLTKAQSKVYFERLVKMLDDTFSIRQRRISALQEEIKYLTQHIQNLRRAQDEFLLRNSVLQNIANNYGDLKNGTVTPSPLGTDPLYDEGFKNSVILQYEDKEALAQNAELIKSPGTVFSIPQVTLATRDIMDRLRSLEKAYYRYTHLIKSARLKIEMNRAEIERLNSEASSVEGGT